MAIPSIWLDLCRTIGGTPQRRCGALAPYQNGANAAAVSHEGSARSDMDKDLGIAFTQKMRQELSPVQKLKDLLVAYLLAANYPPWPGADGATADDALSTYLQASAHGLVPGPAELRNRHPELAKQVDQFFAPSPVTEKPEI
jgi:hypothetical protein